VQFIFFYPTFLFPKSHQSVKYEDFIILPQRRIYPGCFTFYGLAVKTGSIALHNFFTGLAKTVIVLPRDTRNIFCFFLVLFLFQTFYGQVATAKSVALQQKKIIFIKFIFEPQQVFFQIRIKNSWG